MRKASVCGIAAGMLVALATVALVAINAILVVSNHDTSVGPPEDVLRAQVLLPAVKLISPRGTGSGVVILWRGGPHILTAAHVAEGCGYLTAEQTWDGGDSLQQWRCAVIRCGKPGVCDLALLSVPDGFSLPAARFGGAVRIKVGEWCWYCGAPTGVFGCLERSVVSQPRTRFLNHHMMLVNGNGWYGNSGSGVFVARAGGFVLVGIITNTVWRDARTPIACESQATIAAFLEN